MQKVRITLKSGHSFIVCFDECPPTDDAIKDAIELELPFFAKEDIDGVSRLMLTESVDIQKEEVLDFSL